MNVWATTTVAWLLVTSGHLRQKRGLENNALYLMQA